MARRKNPISKAEARRKAAARAARQNAQAQANLNNDRAAARRGFRHSVAADRGAAAYAKGSLRSTIGSLSDAGLGRYTSQARAELQSRLGDAGNLVAFNRAGYKQDLRDELASIQAKQETLDIAQAADERSAYHNIMDRQREAQQKAREKAREADKRARQFSRDVDQALAEIRSQVQSARGDNGIAHQVERQNLRRDPALRRALEDYLISSQGVGRKVARKAVALYAKRNERGYKPGTLQTAGAQGAYLAGVVGFDPQFGPDRDKLPWE